MPVAFSERYFTTSDGPRIHYRDYPATGTARGAPALCLHGLTRNETDFEDLAPMIAAQGRRVIAATQRGRGLSDHDPKPEHYLPAVYAGDMLSLLGSLGIDRAVFVGTSMGGIMTMLTAAAAPQRLAAAVLNDIGPVLDPAGLARIRSYTGVARPAQSWAESAAIARELNQGAFPSETGEAFWLTVARRTFREAAPGRLELDYDPLIARGVQPPPEAPAGPEPDLWRLFDALKPIPTLVIRGALSDLLATGTLEEMKRRKPDLATAEVPDVGHAPYMTEPAAWAALRGFLAAAP
ncbi:MAG TPA: alpha/beta hydrolase [Caulobacteraceae bacterium]|nr:alpha/beta hydrolase [Caulobacteraceae bacterium]